ncbi:MAG: 2,3-bisphosphoglycerate-independent phosphoglycerate mutase [Bacteriovoracia bacterium]
MKAKSVLIILDGFGIGKDSPFNAIQNADMPFYKEIWKKYPHSQLLTHGAAVGLPDGVMGNSEVGHMTIGSGRTIYQDLVRINHAIRDKQFNKNAVLRKTIEAGAQKNGKSGTVHLLGLLSDGGVHSHIDHLFALLELSHELKVPRVALHLMLDGRDTPPQSSIGYVEKLTQHPAFQSTSTTDIRIATIQGRYWGMDRDQRWDRIGKSYQAMTGQIAPLKATPLAAIQKSHALGKSDEFVEPVLLDKDFAIRPGDSLVFFNYRSDRARQISQVLTTGAHGIGPAGLSAFCGMTVYDAKLNLPAAFAPQSLENIFGACLEKQGAKQFRIAETEKYAHVTFFFNGGREAVFQGEDRLLIPSPKDVPTYDLKPEMSAFAVAAEAAQRITQGTYDFVLMNFANADMVGHTGNYTATVKAMEALDKCLAQVIGAAEKNGYHVLLTADHGNAEEMEDHEHRPHTQHTLNPVPAIWIAPGSALGSKKDRVALKDGTLADVMPTLCGLMGIDLPREVTGKNLC